VKARRKSKRKRDDGKYRRPIPQAQKKILIEKIIGAMEMKDFGFGTKKPSTTGKEGSLRDSKNWPRMEKRHSKIL